jgi:hypothetical protein
MTNSATQEKFVIKSTKPIEEDHRGAQDTHRNRVVAPKKKKKKKTADPKLHYSVHKKTATGPLS